MCHPVPTLNGEWADWYREMWYIQNNNFSAHFTWPIPLTLVLGVVAPPPALYSIPTFTLERDDVPLPPIIILTDGIIGLQY